MVGELAHSLENSTAPSKQEEKNTGVATNFSRVVPSYMSYNGVAQVVGDYFPDSKGFSDRFTRRVSGAEMQDCVDTTDDERHESNLHGVKIGSLVHQEPRKIQSWSNPPLSPASEKLLAAAMRPEDSLDILRKKWAYRKLKMHLWEKKDRTDYVKERVEYAAKSSGRKTTQ